MIDRLAFTRSKRSLELGARQHLIRASGHKVAIGDVIGFRDRRVKGEPVHTWAQVTDITIRPLAGLVTADLPRLGYPLSLYSAIGVRERLMRALHVRMDEPIRWIAFEVLRAG